MQTIQAVLAPYLASAKAAVGILNDSFSKTKTEEQCSLMRNLGALAVAVEVGTVPEIRTLSKYQFLPAPTGTGEGAFPVVSTVVKLEDRLREVLETSAVLSHFEGTG